MQWMAKYKFLALCPVLSGLWKYHCSFIQKLINVFNAVLSSFHHFNKHLKIQGVSLGRSFYFLLFCLFCVCVCGCVCLLVCFVVLPWFSWFKCSPQLVTVPTSYHTHISLCYQQCGRHHYIIKDIGCWKCDTLWSTYREEKQIKATSLCFCFLCYFVFPFYKPHR